MKNKIINVKIKVKDIIIFLICFSNDKLVAQTTIKKIDNTLLRAIEISKRNLLVENINSYKSTENNIVKE